MIKNTFISLFITKIYEGHSKGSQPYHVLNSLEDIWIAASMQLFYRQIDTKFSEFIFSFNLLRLQFFTLTRHTL